MEKRRWEKMALEERVSLSEWVRRCCNDVAGAEAAMRRVLKRSSRWGKK